MSELARLRQELAAQAHPDGGWGYVPGQPAHPEPTCLALLALAGDAETYGRPIAAGLLALQANAAADGSYRLARGRHEAAWPTALALFTRAALGHTGLERTAAALRTMRGSMLPGDPEVADMIDIDP